jgi:hypothetical protein
MSRHIRYCREQRIARRRAAAMAYDRGVAMGLFSSTPRYEENASHNTHHHVNSAKYHREKAAEARKGGWLSGPNEERAKQHEAVAEQHEAKEKDPEYHRKESEHHRNEAEKLHRSAGSFFNVLYGDDQQRMQQMIANKARAHEAMAEHHERQAAKWDESKHPRDPAGKFD